MQTVVNPVQVVSDFLKDPFGAQIMKKLGATNRIIELGAIDDVSVILGKDGFRIRNGEREEAASAYDVYDIFTAQPSADTATGEVMISFARFIHERLAAQT